MLRTVSMPVGLVAILVATASAHAGESRPGLCGTPADAFFAEAIGMRREWIVQVPFDSAASRLEHVTVADGIAIAAAGDGSLHAIAATRADGQPAPGTVLWSRRVGGAADGLHPPAIGGGIVVVADAFHVFALDRRTGRTLWQEPLPSPPTAAAVVSGDQVYLPLEGGRLLRMPVDPYRQPVIERVIERKRDGDKKKPVEAARTKQLPLGEKLESLSIAAHGRVEFAPLPFQGGVLWCTTDGLLTALVPAKPKWQRLEFVLDRTPAGPPLVRDEAIVVATHSDGMAADVIRVDRLPIGMVFSWRVPIAEGVAGDIAAVGDTLLVPLATGGLTALSARDGTRLWTHDQSLKLLAVTSQRLWCLDATGRLATVDPADGSRLQRFCLGPFRLPVPAASSDRLVLASADGVVAMLAPRAAPAAATAAPAAE